ncbi:MAG: DUF485 domain-containing protein [Vogesella sp.]|uniref:DUF485 domain-containing protein n=1 Tax=Vogesella sp. TaxID=1904252 RepID=UPI00391DEA32
MSTQASHAIRQHPQFAILVRKRSTLAWTLAALTLASYYLFMLVVAVAPASLHQPLQAGGVLSLGVPVGAAIIVFTWALTGYYVYRANTEFDRLTATILQESQP